MFRLVNTELRRFSLRSAFWWAGIAVVAIMLIALFSQWNGSRPPSASDLESAKSMHASAVEEWKSYRDSPDYQANIDQCELDKQNQVNDYPADYDCDGWVEPQLADFLYQSHYETEAIGGISGFITFLLIVALVIGVSFITAEISSGAIGNYLSFEPRRTRVFWSKAIALVIWVPFASAVLITIFGLLQYLIFSTNGALGQVTPELQRSVALMGVRGVIATGVLVLIGFAIGTLTRHAAIALGAVIGYLVAIELTLRGIFNGIQDKIFSVNLTAWIDGSASYYIETCERSPEGYTSCSSKEMLLYQGQAGWYLLIVTAVLTGIAWLVFRRRDVS